MENKVAKRRQPNTAILGLDNCNLLHTFIYIRRETFTSISY